MTALQDDDLCLRIVPAPHATEEDLARSRVDREGSLMIVTPDDDGEGTTVAGWGPRSERDAGPLGQPQEES